MHTWKPDAYSEAPVPSAAILSSAMLNCALYGLIRFYILASRCLGAEFPGRLLLLFGLLSMGISVPFVLVQRNFRRLLAYHTIDHAGIMVTALGIGGALGSLGLMLHMTFHTIAKSLLFLCAGNVLAALSDRRCSHGIKGGVIRAMPLDRRDLSDGHAGDHRDAAVQSVSERIPHCARGVRGRPSLTGVLFVLFGTGVFAGALLHVGGMVLGPPGDTPVAGRRPWRNGSLLVARGSTGRDRFLAAGSACCN